MWYTYSYKRRMAYGALLITLSQIIISAATAAWVVDYDKPNFVSADPNLYWFSILGFYFLGVCFTLLGVSKIVMGLLLWIRVEE